MVGAWVRIASFFKSLYPCMISLDFSISFVNLFFTSYTIFILKIQSLLCWFVLYCMNLKTSLLASTSISNVSNFSNGLLGAVIILFWQSLIVRSYESFFF
jgi:hypothetical protein